MRGARSDRGRQQNRFNRVGNSPTNKPVGDHHQEQQQREATVSDESLSIPSSSQSIDPAPTTFRNPRIASRNRRRNRVKPRFVQKFDGNPPKSGAGVLEHELDSSRKEDVALEFNLNLEGSPNAEREEHLDYDGKVNGEKEKELNTEESNEGKINNDPMSVLNELLLSADEPGLTEEELRMDDQAQEDELLAMEHIYGDNMFILERQKGLRCFQIHVNIDTSSEHAMTAKLNLHDNSDEDSDDFLYSFKVQYLPPIVLTCLLPKAYPSHVAPIFTISVQWLNPDSISGLCTMLDSIWIEQAGQEVLYQWADWLQNSSLSYLGFDDQIILGPYGVSSSSDKRAFSGSRSPDIDIPLIRSYNDERHHENFLTSLQECCICFSEYPGTEFARLPCRHIFCWKCMKTYSGIHVSEGTVSKLQCPDSKCKGMVPPGLLKRLLGEEEFERWESLLLQKTLESMTDIAYCPRCETPCLEDDEQHALCSKCFYSFCTLCRERRHVGETCMTPEMKLRILQERQSSNSLNENQRIREREMINEILSVKEIFKDAKQCPSCKIAISRIEGCNKMVCYNCGQYFCYLCCKVITGYEHFREGTCDLFPEAAIREWEERLNPRQAVGQAQAQLFPNRGLVCPICRQFNAKIGNNNHLFCWACQAHYCYLCKKIVKRGSQHYGPKGCKQHTEG